jgi:hypothetical protein
MCAPFIKNIRIIYIHMSKQEKTKNDTTILENFKTLLDNSDFLEETSSINAIIKLLKENGDIIKSSSFFDIDEHIYHYYDIIIATIFEKITTSANSIYI